MWTEHGNMYYRVTACSKPPTSPSSIATRQCERSGSFDLLQKGTPSFSFQKVCSQEINDNSFCSFWQLFYQTVPNEFCETLFASCADNQKSF
ncbi:rCG40823, isoform CRA_a [Rattus norvegicus]|uniref:RCG40823, isoform CRA_a n=1 Tax=Rattus norvegicus TaxID=10116 RepID=A6KRZ7_RAT|nr:rCG40823, isoform CRA_a [Rattus norvegicus]